VTGYAPLGSPDSAALTKRDASVPKLMEHPTVTSIAAKLGKSPAQARDRAVARRRPPAELRRWPRRGSARVPWPASESGACFFLRA
jgi:hypothetical protein